MLTNQSLQNLRQAVRECRSCELGCSGKVGEYYNPTPSSGPMDAEVVVIGRNPGQQEERLGEPLIGPAGMLFTQFLDLCGIAREYVYLTNLALCFSIKNRAPLPEEYEACSKWKKLEFSLLKPKLVMLLGNDVFHHFYPSKSKESVLGVQGQVWDGFEIEGYGSGYKVMAFPHPSFYLRQRQRIAVEWGVGSTIVKGVVRILDIRKGVRDEG